MRSGILLLALLPMFFGMGCQRMVLRSRVAFDAPMDTRVTDFCPVSPVAGPVKPVVVNQGAGNPRVAIIDVDGLILNTPFSGPMSLGENPVALFREKLNAAEADNCVRAIVLRMHSHGGGVAACIAMRRDLEHFRARTGKPVVACLMDTATGGAYYVASAADHVVATSGTVTGGIGVILNLFNLQDLMAQFNVIPQSIKAGELVDIGSSARPLKAAERELLQTMADDFHRQLQVDVQKVAAQGGCGDGVRWPHLHLLTGRCAGIGRSHRRSGRSHSDCWPDGLWRNRGPASGCALSAQQRSGPLDLRRHRQRTPTRSRSSAESAGARPGENADFPVSLAA